MKALKISWQKILLEQIPNVEIDFSEGQIHYKQVMELARLGYKVPQSIIDYKDNEIEEDEDNPFFSDNFIQHIKEDYMSEVKLIIPKKYLEYTKQQKLNISNMLISLIDEQMQVRFS